MRVRTCSWYSLGVNDDDEGAAAGAGVEAEDAFFSTGGAEIDDEEGEAEGRYVRWCARTNRKSSSTSSDTSCCSLSKCRNSVSIRGGHEPSSVIIVLLLLLLLLAGAGVVGVAPGLVDARRHEKVSFHQNKSDNGEIAYSSLQVFQK